MNYLVVCDDFYLAKNNLIDKLKDEKLTFINYDEKTNLNPYLNKGLFDTNSDKTLVIINPLFLYKDFKNEEAQIIINNLNNSDKKIYLIVNSKYDTKKEKFLKINGKIDIKSLEDKNNSKIEFIKKELSKNFKKYPEWLAYSIDKKTNFESRLIINEIQKLIWLDDEDLNDSEVVEKVLIDHSDRQIYNLTKVIINKNTEETLMIYEDLIMDKRQPSEIISTLITMFSKIYFMLLGKKMKLSDEEIAKKMSVNLYWVKYTYRDIQIKSSSLIKEFIANLLKLDINNKRSLVDSYQSLKYFIIKGVN
ncbi:DNA polymerase III subunit delta [Mycoplasma sp. E35C]|uniref:DNA polymerase III subunit delta n=1 Tax=Mycoplasma sp. E35C TaxID=2801918 RepID=UPI001CA3B026|nr:DNA polymerase III subunit delta [Mycoplasma sp. E35C]QZX49002.1 DNA polymerase III subunit delta [Mycoplasma sp. E35C]